MLNTGKIYNRLNQKPFKVNPKLPPTPQIPFPADLGLYGRYDMTDKFSL